MTFAAPDRSPESARRPPNASHSVLFYKDERGLFASVAEFVQAGLDARQPVVVIATAEHRDGFARALAAEAKVDDAVDRGEVVWIDAGEMLSRIVVDDAPDADRFAAAVSPLLERVVARSGAARVRAYGEMVDVLCQAGQPDRAIWLEQMWNALARRYPMDLFCAYEIEHATVDPLVHERVCDVHDHASATHDAAGTHARLCALTELRQFLATVSRELRSPLNAILGWARLLAARATDPYIARAASSIVRNGEAQARIIDDLLDVSRINGERIHGGTTRVESGGVGQGATFVVALPADDSNAPPEATAGAAGAARETSLRGVSVLVVDDDMDAREVVAELLASFGAVVTTTGSAQEARALIPTSRPDVIISDIGMPGEDGYSFARTVRALPRDQGGATPIIAVTGYAGPHDRMRALAAGFDDHIAKPMDPDELARAIREAAGAGRR